MKLFLLPAATLLMANGAYASVRGATTEIVDFIDNGRIDYQCNFADDQKRTCPEEEWTMQDDGSAEAKGPFDCGTDGDTQLGCCTITAPKDVVDAWQTARNKKNDRRANEIGEEVMTFDLRGHGTCNLATLGDDTDSSTSPDMFESELSNGIELGEDELYPEFLQLEGKCSCDKDKDCKGDKVCVTGNCNTKNSGNNSGQCKNPNNKNSNNKSNRNKSGNCSNKSKSNCKDSSNCKYKDGKCKDKNSSNKSSNSKKCKNRSKSSCKDSSNCKYKDGKCKDKSVDDVLEELIAEEDEKAELSNGIEFVEEENRSCRRDSECRRDEFCNDRDRCQRDQRSCRSQSDCGTNDFCNYDRGRCARATGRSCSNGTDCGNNRGSQWMCRDGRCKPRSLFELAMERVMHGEGVMFDLDEAMEEE